MSDHSINGEESIQNRDSKVSVPTGVCRGSLLLHPLDHSLFCFSLVFGHKTMIFSDLLCVDSLRLLLCFIKYTSYLHVLSLPFSFSNSCAIATGIACTFFFFFCDISI